MIIGNRALLFAADDIAQSNREFTKKFEDMSKKFEDMSKIEIESRDRVDITLKEYERMKREIDSLTLEVDRLRNILDKFEIPFDKNIIADSIQTYYCKDHMNFRYIFRVEFAIDEGEMRR